ncbi:MAG: single-stranded DNA-binding protein [Azospirillum sp.]|nr:single-stranded DNA-binding protein [Azospirillum sp.]
MASVNKVILVGNVGRDPEARTMGSGGKVVNLSVATSETWKDKNSGERQEKTEWHRVVIFNEKIADVAERYVKKGSRIYIEGALQTRKWTDKDGAEKYATEIVLQKFRGELVLLGEKNGTRTAGSPEYDDAHLDPPKPQTATPRKPAPIDDDVPF